MGATSSFGPAGEVFLHLVFNGQVVGVDERRTGAPQSPAQLGVFPTPAMEALVEATETVKQACRE
jgi:hypothetical protein